MFPTVPTVPDRPLEAAESLRAGLRRVLTLLSRAIGEQRAAGRPPAGDVLRGVALEEGEVERLVEELATDLTRPAAASRPVESPQAPPGPGPGYAPGSAAVPGPGGSEPPLARARRLFRLDEEDYDGLLLSLAVESDARFARIVAFLNDHVSRTRPTVGLVVALAGRGTSAVAFCRRPVVREGLLRLEGEGPISGLALRVAPEFLPRLGAPGTENPDECPPGVRLRFRAGPGLEALIIDPAARALLKRWSATLSPAGPGHVLVLAGRSGSGRATAAGAASFSAGRPLVEVTWQPDQPERLPLAAREALWHEATLLVRVPDGLRDPDFALLGAALAPWSLPVAWAVPAEGAEAAGAFAPGEPLVLRLEAPSIERREALLKRFLKDLGPPRRVRVSAAERAELAARYDFPPGLLARAVRRAVAERTGVGGRVDFEALSRACRAVGAAGMGTIAQRLPQPYTRADLVLPRSLLDELDLASAWMRNRRRVFETWGFGRRVALGRGLTALFAGQPGTGKTMAAQVVARELGLEIFRVDLSRVMSKYIGDTEKNLSRLFDDAQASGAILFFDEADALFGKRSEVKDAHDRYANLEIGYLLQRMEEHLGTTILATNRLGDLDEAFTRRFHFILDFPMPGPSERRRIWEGMLPPEAARDADLPLGLDALAGDYELSGGEIRNCVLSAAFIAAEEGHPIGSRHLQRGLRRELLKTGRVLDPRQRDALRGGS